MDFDFQPFATLLTEIVDNRGKTCPTASEGIPLIATNCISNNLLYPAYEKVRFVDKKTYDTWFRGHPKPGDLLFVTKGTPGRVCMVPNPVDFCIAQDMVAIRADENKIYPKYLFAILRTDYVQKQIEQLHVGTLIPHFKKGDFDKLMLPIPDRQTQIFVGDLYFNFSAKIDLNRQMNETLEAMARAIFKSWFVDFDPVRAKAEGRDTGLPKEIADLFPDSFEETELGEVPKGWLVGTLENYVNLNPENWSKDITPESIEYVDLANTKWGTIDSTSTYLWKNAPSRAQRVLRSGDTIIGTVRPGNGSYSIISENGLTGSTAFAVLRPKNAIFVSFVYLAVTDEDNIKRLAYLADGGAYPAIRPDVVLATPVVYANISVIERFASIVKPLIDKIEENKHEFCALAKVRDTLLPKLISGELRTETNICGGIVDDS